VVNRIETALERLNRTKKEACSAAALLDRLDQAILAKAFCGELVPQDPNEEPASVLLDRIRAARAAEGKPATRRSRLPRIRGRVTVTADAVCSTQAWSFFQSARERATSRAMRPTLGRAINIDGHSERRPEPSEETGRAPLGNALPDRGIGETYDCLAAVTRSAAPAASPVPTRPVLRSSRKSGNR
jgi:hypothetical protein